MDFFDASKVTPSQGAGGHPPGRFPFQITNTYVRENNAKTGGMLVVEMTSDVGRIENRYNIWNQSEKAVEIAQKELSALCHATGIFRLTFPKDPAGMPIPDQAARELRGGRGVMDIAPQTDKEGKPNGYMEVKKIFDSAGNEPGKGGSQPQPQQAAQQAPQTQQQPTGGGWGNPPPSNPPSTGGWAAGPNTATPSASPPWGASK